MDRPIPPWEQELAAEALAELKRNGAQIEPEILEPVSADLPTAPQLDELERIALKKADAALLIQQVDRMIAEGKAESSKIGMLANNPTPVAEANILRILFSKHSLSIGVAILLITFVLLLYAMMRIVSQMSVGLTVQP